MERDFCILIHTVRIQTTVSLYSSSPDSYRNRESFYHVIIPSAQWSWRWVYWFHLVRPSVSALFSMLFSALWLGCGELGMRKYSPRYGWNADIMRIFLRIPVRILPPAFSPHFLRIFFHIRMRRFLRVPVRILPSAFSPQGKCGDLGYGPGGFLTHYHPREVRNSIYRYRKIHIDYRTKFSYRIISSISIIYGNTRFR